MSAITRSDAWNPGFRVTKQEARLREKSPPRPKRSVARLPIALGLRVAIVIAVAQPHGVLADVWPQAFSGVPEQVIPQYHEVGAPTFVMPQGSQSATPQGAAGGQNTGTTGGIGSVSSPGFVASGFTQYLGQSVGSGQCVALVQSSDPGVGLTATWAQGAAVQGNTSLQPGTAIATFNSNGQYANATDGSSHAAIYLGQNADGIQVEDQWVGQPAHIHTIAWTSLGNSTAAANNGSQYYVVSHTS